MKTITQKAEYFRSFFELKEVKREGETEPKQIYVNKDHNNELVKNLCFAAHNDGEILPDDFRYRKIVDTLDMLIDNNIEDEERAQDLIMEMEADIYTSDLTAWLHSRNDRIYYLTEALEEFGCKNGFQALMTAQTIEIQEIATAVLNYIINAEIEEEE